MNKKKILTDDVFFESLGQGKKSTNSEKSNRGRKPLQGNFKAITFKLPEADIKFINDESIRLTGKRKEKVTQREVVSMMIDIYRRTVK